MSELTQLLRSQYTTDRHIVAGVGEHTTTAGQTSSHFFGRLAQRFERSLSAEVRQRNRAGVDAYIAQIRAVNADLADAAVAALSETRAQGKPLTVRRVRELGLGEISPMVQQQAAALMQDFFARGVFRAEGQWHGDANDEQRLTMVRQSIELAWRTNWTRRAAENPMSGSYRHSASRARGKGGSMSSMSNRASCFQQRSPMRSGVHSTKPMPNTKRGRFPVRLTACCGGPPLR
jgi:hypothetical protein